MSKHPKEEQDEVVSMVPGASVIDIQSLRAEMNDETDALLNELANDKELQKDVLEGFEAAVNDQELEQLSESVQAATEKQNREYAKLAKKVAKQLNEDLELTNQMMISEDQALEASIAADSDADSESSVETEEMSEQDAELKAALPQLNENGEYHLEDLQSCIEALLFYSDRPLSIKKMKEMLEMESASNEVLLQAVDAIKAQYANDARGFEVADIAGGYQLRTKPKLAPLLRKLAKVQVQRLSRGAMETLTIVAYKQPCTKDDIDQVRGVDSSHFIRTLLDRRLIEIQGRSESAGRPMIYATTEHFMEVFGIMDLSALPALREIEAMVPQMAAAEAGAEDPRVVQMRKLVQQMKADGGALDYDAKEDDQILAEIRERVKTIDVTTPYLARQKELAEQGIVGEAADELLAKEFGFDTRPEAASAEMSTETSAEISAEELAQIAITAEQLELKSE